MRGSTSRNDECCLPAMGSSGKRWVHSPGTGGCKALDMLLQSLASLLMHKALSVPFHLLHKDIKQPEALIRTLGVK